MAFEPNWHPRRAGEIPHPYVKAPSREPDFDDSPICGFVKTYRIPESFFTVPSMPSKPLCTKFNSLAFSQQPILCRCNHPRQGLKTALPLKWIGRHSARLREPIRGKVVVSL